MKFYNFFFYCTLTKLRQICIDSRLLIENETKVSSKIKALVDILKGSISNGHKILVFSQFPTALQLVRQELDNEKIWTICSFKFCNS